MLCKKIYTTGTLLYHFLLLRSWGMGIDRQIAQHVPHIGGRHLEVRGSKTVLSAIGLALVIM